MSLFRRSRVERETRRLGNTVIHSTTRQLPRRRGRHHQVWLLEERIYNNDAPRKAGRA